MTESLSRIRTTPPMLALVVGAALTFGALVTTRPALGEPASWSGDDLAIVALWWGALIGSVWLAATTLAYFAALAQGRARFAQRVARLAPPFARRILQTALVGAWALAPSVAAAAPPSAPITVHVDSRGRITTATGRTARTEDPARRSPDRRHTTTTTTTTIGGRAATTRPADTTTTIRPAPLLPSHAPPTNTTPSSSPSSSPSPSRAPSPAPTPARLPAPITAPSRERIHVVVPGDNLWQIARAEVARASGTYRPSDAQIAPYWNEVIAENRTTLRSGDPSLIFPGEVVELP